MSIERAIKTNIVIARSECDEAIQSRANRTGLLRYARNDGRGANQ